MEGNYWWELRADLDHRDLSVKNFERRGRAVHDIREKITSGHNTCEQNSVKASSKGGCE